MPLDVGESGDMPLLEYMSDILLMSVKSLYITTSVKLTRPCCGQKADHDSFHCMAKEVGARGHLSYCTTRKDDHKSRNRDRDRLYPPSFKAACTSAIRLAAVNGPHHTSTAVPLPRLHSITPCERYYSPHFMARKTAKRSWIA